MAKLARKQRATGLSRQRIVDATIDYLRQHPKGRLSLSTAGAAVGATSMAIYRHFKDSADLADAILAQVLDGVGERASDEGDWRVLVRAWMDDVCQRLLETSQCVDILASTRGNSPAWMNATVSLRTALKKSGLPDRPLEEAMFWITLTLSGFAQRALATPLDEQIAGSISALENLEARDGVDFTATKVLIPEIFTDAREIMMKRMLASVEMLVQENRG